MYTLKTATGNIDVYGDPPASHKRYIVPAEEITGEDVDGVVTGNTEFFLPDQIELTQWAMIANGKFIDTPFEDYTLSNEENLDGDVVGKITFTKAPLEGDSVLIIYKSRN